MPALRDAGISHQQFLAVWSTNADIGFTPAQLLAAGITITEMQSNDITLAQIHAGGVSITYLLETGLTISQLYTGGIPGYLLFNDVCNTPLSVGTSPGPTIKLLTTQLTATNTQVLLEGRAESSLTWTFSNITTTNNVSNTVSFLHLDTINSTKMLRSAIAVYLRAENRRIVSTLSIPLAEVFSSLTIEVADNRFEGVSMALCSGR